MESLWSRPRFFLLKALTFLGYLYEEAPGGSVVQPTFPDGPEGRGRGQAQESGCWQMLATEGREPPGGSPTPNRSFICSKTFKEHLLMPMTWVDAGTQQGRDPSPDLKKDHRLRPS